MEVDRNSDKYLYPAEVKYIVMIYINSINWFYKEKSVRGISGRSYL